MVADETSLVLTCMTVRRRRLASTSCLRRVGVGRVLAIEAAA